MRLLLILLALAGPLLLLPGPATAQSVQASVGRTLLELPLPEGFVDGLRGQPAMRQIGERMTPPGNRLLGLFLSRADRTRLDAGEGPRMERYFMSQTLRAAENSAFGQGDFQPVRELLRGQYQSLLKSLAPAFKEQLDAAADGLKRDSGIDQLSLKMGELRGLEIFDDRDTSISLLAVTKYQVQVGERVEEVPMAMSITTATVRGKLVYFYAYAVYRSAADLDWVREVTRAWLPQAATANPL